MNPRPEIVLAHDYLTQRGGAERVALELAKQFRPAAIYTSLYAPMATFEALRDFPIEESGGWPLRAFRRDPRLALPLLAWAWSRRSPVAARVAICSSSGWAHALPVSASTLKVVYCHNPARWLYQAEDYLRGRSLLVRTALSILAPALRRWDAKAARSADVYIANSSSVARRIKRAYGIDAHLVFPPLSIDPNGEMDAVPGVEPGFFLTVGRARGYKGVDILEAAFAEVPAERLVVVGGDQSDRGTFNVSRLGRVSEAQLRWLYANATALISVSHEDFGLTPIEANALGTPALLLRAGGFVDSTEEGVSGLFIDSDDPGAVAQAVRAFPRKWDEDALRRHAAKFSPEAFATSVARIILDELGESTEE